MRTLIRGQVEQTPADPPQPPQRSSLSIWAAWREHPWLTVMLFLGGLAAALPAAWFLGTPEYLAEASIYVSPTFLKNVEEDTEQKRQYDTFVQQQVTTITRVDILTESLEAAKLAGFEWTRKGETEAVALERLRKALEIRRIPETYQISVGLRSAKAKGLSEFVNGLVNNFLSKARAEEFYGQKERLQTLEKERNALDEELRVKQLRQSDLAGLLGVANFSPTLPNPYDLALTKTKEDLNGARNRKLEAEVALDLLETQNGSSTGAIAVAMGADPELTRLRTALNNRRLELNTSLQGLGPNHPLRVSAEREIQENEAELKRVTERTRERVAGQLLTAAREELRRARHVEAGLATAIATQSARAGRFSQTLQEGVTLTLEMERLRARRNAIDDRIRYLTVESSAPGFLRIFSPALPPDRPTKGRRTLLFAVFFAFTFALTCFVPLGVELWSTRLRNARKVEKLLGFPPVGELLGASEASPEFREEQIARLVTGLERSHESMMARTFLITPLEAGADTTAMTRLLGSELQKRGKRTLVIETGDPMPSDAQAIAGLQDVLDDTSNASVAIQSTNGVDHIQAGPRALGTRFRNLHKMPELIEKLLTRYDLILLSANPLFLSSDAEYLVRCSDVTLLHADSRRARKGQLLRTKQLLDRIEPGGLGVILSDVDLSDADALMRRDLRQFESHRRLSICAPSTPALPADESKQYATLNSTNAR